MMSVKTSVAVLAGVAALIVANNFWWTSICHQSVANFTKYTATKSPYFFSSDTTFNFSKRSGSAFQYTPPGCVAESLWIIARHGTRNPGTKIMSNMIRHSLKLQADILKAHQDLRGELCASELSALRNWHPHPNCFDATKEKWLVLQGEKELYGIGERFSQRYPNLFSLDPASNAYNFKYTKTQRAEASAKAFTEGSFGIQRASSIQYPEALRADPVLRFYKACSRWKEEVDKNPDTYKERIKFENSEVFRQMLQKLQKRLGLNQSLKVSDVDSIYVTCSFESAWNPEAGSPWCRIFDEEDLQILEYRQDLEYYWVDGYGYELTYRQACSPVADIIQQFRSKQRNQTAPVVTAYFTHSGTILKLISHLGLFKDHKELLSDSFWEHGRERKWRTSFIDKFATNIALVLFRCADEASETTHKIGLLFQEEPMEAPFCGGRWLCSLDKFEAHFKHSVDDCAQKVQVMCESKSRGEQSEDEDTETYKIAT